MRYFLIGILGSGMSSLAHILLDKGFIVEGCDTVNYVYTKDDLLIEKGMRVTSFLFIYTRSFSFPQ